VIFVAIDADRVGSAPALAATHLWIAPPHVELFAESQNAEVPPWFRRNATCRPRFSDVSRFQLEDIMKIRLVLLATAVAALPTLANAQSTTGQGAASGAAAGGQVGGPVGAIVGGTVGAAVGAAAEIPNAFITSVQRSNEPSVVVRERIVVGEPLPATVRLRSVPQYPNYRYAIVNDQRVIVEPRTRKVVHIIQ
jgi:hypothetical protein